MKKLLLMAALCAAMLSLSACKDDKATDDGKKPVAPAITLEGADIDAPQQIVEGMQVKVAVSAPGKIRNFTVSIDSPFLNEQMLATVGLSKELSLSQPASDEIAGALAVLGFPVGAEVVGKEQLSFDLSKFVPMIAAYEKTSDHKFTLTVSDSQSQQTVKTLTLHLTGTNSVTYNEDADLWNNTASLKIELGAEAADVKLEYRRANSDKWQQAAVTAAEDGTYAALLAPAWNKAGTHAQGAQQFSLDGMTGVFAGTTYAYRLWVDGTEITEAAGSFTTEDGTTVPDGAMEKWVRTYAYLPDYALETNPSAEELETYKVYYPNLTDADTFWANGNNMFTPQLCYPDTLPDNSVAARLKGNVAMGTIFAAGNLFTGVFNMDGFGGFARFGQKYAFEARPRALRVKCKASVNTITTLNADEEFPLPSGVTVGAKDPCRIFVCITDWPDRHSVHSGVGVPADSLNVFDPEKQILSTNFDKQGKVVENGRVLAYASKTITEGIEDWSELQLDLLWLDKEARPGKGNYSLVISAASNAYGDYLCGCSENELYLDDIEWVY